MMSRTRVVTGVVLSLALAGAARAAEPAAGSLTSRQAFDRLKSLAGEWQGTAMAKDGPPATVRYEVVSAGHAVMERLFPGTEHEMLSLYYLEGDQLVMTHYCAMGNQPRMRFAKGGPSNLSFAFAGGTNFDPKKDTHIHSARYSWPDEGHLEAEWAVYQGEKQTGAHKVFLSRKK
jgi:hypothetical protein